MSMSTSTSPLATPFRTGAAFITLAASAFSFVPSAFAQNEYVPPGGQNTQSTPSGEYVPPQGEQPEYGKKYRPTTPEKDLILEINPLLVINRGIAVEFERRSGDTLSFGLDLIYRDAKVFDERGVEGSVQYLGAAPKVRVYPLATLGGVFFGAKIMLGQNTLAISDNDDIGIFTVSPTAHVGYRFTTFSGFTLAGYLGGGVNIPAPEYEKEDLDVAYRESDAHNDARSRVNRATGLFKPDIGLTLGIAL